MFRTRPTTERVPRRQVRQHNLIGSRDVSDPRTDPGVRVPGPQVGSLTSRLLSCAGHPRGEGRRAFSIRSGATTVRNLKRSARTKSSRHVVAIVGVDESYRSESANMLEGRWSPRRPSPPPSPRHLPLTVVSPRPLGDAISGFDSCEFDAARSRFRGSYAAVVRELRRVRPIGFDRY